MQRELLVQRCQVDLEEMAVTALGTCISFLIVMEMVQNKIEVKMFFVVTVVAIRMGMWVVREGGRQVP